MPQYDYEIVNGEGELTKGQIEAASPAEVARRLGRDGQTLVGVTETPPNTLPALRRRLRTVDLVIAFRELATLLSSGVSLGDAVISQSKGSYHPELVAAFNEVSRELMRGTNFLGALRAAKLPLPDHLYHLVEAGELSGHLAESLTRAVEQMEYDRHVAAELRSALTYPAILVASCAAAVLAVFLFVVPEFVHLLEEDVELPLISELVLGAGASFNDNRWLLGAILIAIAFTVVALFRNPNVRQRFVDALARLPLLGQWYSETDTAKWAMVMGAMLTSRVELVGALGLASRGVRVSRRRAMLDRALAAVRGGQPLSAALEKEDALTATGYNLIRVGEQSGQLPEMMRSLATLYEENSSRRMKRVLTLIEPVAILCIGAFIGMIFIGVILAITAVNNVPL